jgi:hypothetical protein
MQTTAETLLPLFVAGFAVSRLLEFAAIIWEWAAPKSDKTAAMAGLSIVAASLLTWGTGLSVIATPKQPWIGYGITILVLSAGTEGANSILKFLSYKKEETEAKVKTEQQTLEVLRKHSQ